MTDTTHDDLHRAQVDIWRYAQAEAAGALPAPRIGVRAADWITRHGRAYADMVEVCRRDITKRLQSPNDPCAAPAEP